MKKLFLFVLILFVFQEGKTIPWTPTQPVQFDDMRAAMELWGSVFIPFDQHYQLGDNDPSSMCHGASIVLMSNLFSSYYTLQQSLQMLTVDAATPGNFARQFIADTQAECDSVFDANNTSNVAFVQAMQAYYNLYFNLQMTPHHTFFDAEGQHLLANYAGGGVTDPAMSMAIDSGINRTIQVLRNLFIANPVAGANLNTTFYQVDAISSGSIAEIPTGHCVNVFRASGGHIIFFDPNVGVSIFPDFSHFEIFLRMYYSNETRAVAGSPVAYQVIDYVETFTDLTPAMVQNLGVILCLPTSTTSSARNARSNNLSQDAQNFISNYLDFCTRKLTFKNVNYEDLSIQILLKHTTDVYFPNFETGDELVFDYDQNANKYYYGGYEVQSIDLDEGRNPVGAFDQHDNMDFSWTSNSTITYKPRNLFNAEILIDDYKESAHTQYREVRDADGINGGSANAIISSYRLGAREYIEVKKWGTKKMDLSKLETVRFKNVSYDDIGQKRIRLGNNAWDLWPNLHQGTTIDFDYHGNGVVKHNGSILQQIDMYWTAPTTYYSGDELDFSWYNAQQINYRPYWSNSWNNIPTVTLVDFNNGAYSSYVDADGVQGYTPQMYMKVYVSEDQKVLNIELHGRAAYPNKRHVMALVDHSVKEAVALRLMPNPTNSVLNVSVEGASSGAAYFIYDAMGRMVLQQSIDLSNLSTTIDVSTLQSGLYYIVLPDAEGGKTQEKFIVAY